MSIMVMITMKLLSGRCWSSDLAALPLSLLPWYLHNNITVSKVRTNSLLSARSWLPSAVSAATGCATSLPPAPSLPGELPQHLVASGAKPPGECWCHDQCIIFLTILTSLLTPWSRHLWSPSRHKITPNLGNPPSQHEILLNINLVTPERPTTRARMTTVFT